MKNTYACARELYAQQGVDCEHALKQLSEIALSIHCWQGDDVGGFETPDASITGGGIQATGNYPGKARTIHELREDLEMACSLIPGTHRLNLHASYGDFSGKTIERNQIGFEHFKSWTDWCQEHRMGMDFNPTYFSHPLADDGFTLSHSDPSIRQYWIEHGQACRKIAAKVGETLGSATVTNFWIPDGYKDITIDRKSPRERLEQSLDEIFSEPIDPQHACDAVESKLFGIGSETYVVGSHEFYFGYAIKNQKWLCLDAGHFHPTESIADKISSTLQYVPNILLHLSRGVRWDSDHVISLDDPTQAVLHEIIRGDFLNRVAIGLDFFDASINRVAAWVIGSRNVQKAILQALLEPVAQLKALEQVGNLTKRLALFEACKTLPFGLIWDEFCHRQSVPQEFKWMQEIEAYEKATLSQRT